MSVRAEGQGRAPARMHAVLTPMVHSDVTVNRDLLHANLTCVYALGLNSSAAHTLSLMYIHKFDMPPLIHVIKCSITAEHYEHLPTCLLPRVLFIIFLFGKLIINFLNINMLCCFYCILLFISLLICLHPFEIVFVVVLEEGLSLDEMSFNLNGLFFIILQLSTLWLTLL